MNARTTVEEASVIVCVWLSRRWDQGARNLDSRFLLHADRWSRLMSAYTTGGGHGCRKT